MSLLFDHVIGSFDLDGASLCVPDDDALDDHGDVVPVRPVAEFAGHHDELAHPEADWVCIPLHEPNSARVTDEFVAFTDHSLHGGIFVIERDGERDFVDAGLRSPGRPTGSASGTPTTSRRRTHPPTTRQ